MFKSLFNFQIAKFIVAHYRALLIHCLALFLVPQALWAMDDFSNDLCDFSDIADVKVDTAVSLRGKKEIFIVDNKELQTLFKIKIPPKETENENQDQIFSPKPLNSGGTRSGKLRHTLTLKPYFRSLSLPSFTKGREEEELIGELSNSNDSKSSNSGSKFGGGTADSPKPAPPPFKIERSIIDRIMDMTNSETTSESE